MDIKQDLTYRHQYLDIYTYDGNRKYNYVRDGILVKCLPKILFKGNSIFVTFLQLIDVRLIMLCKYIDKLKRFKYLTWYTT